MTTTSRHTHCPRPGCGFPILPTLDDFDTCARCGWEDYGAPENGIDVPQAVPCPGTRREMDNLRTGVRNSNWGDCPACGVMLRPVKGMTPPHQVFSDRTCEGSMRGLVRVVYKDR